MKPVFCMHANTNCHYNAYAACSCMRARTHAGEGLC